LEQETGQQDWLRDLYCEVYSLDEETAHHSEREVQLDRTVRRLLGEEGIDWVGHGVGRATDAQPLINLWSASNPTGLRAFATELVFRLKERIRDHGAGPALIYVPLSKVMTPECRADRRWVLDRLAMALGIANRRDHLDEAAYDEWEGRLIERIRRALARRHALIVLAGLEACSEPFGTLLDFLKNTDWCTLLKQLIQPYSPSDSTDGSARRSRFLVLSNRALPELRPWMPDEPEHLAPVPTAKDVLDLLLDTQAAVEAKTRMLQRGQSLWPDDGFGPRLEPHTCGLKETYNATAESLRWLRFHGTSMPAELDLTLASWASQRQSLEVVDLDGLSGPQRNQAIFDACMNSLGDAASLALEFIALAVNGLRVSTLRRCLSEYAAATDNKRLQSDIAEFLKRHLSSRTSVDKFAESIRLVLTVSTDEEPAAGLVGRRWFELQANSDDHLRREDQSTSGLVLDLRFEELRELFWARLLPARKEPGAQRRFLAANRILAEEAIAQATSQVRCLPLGSTTSVYALRRFLQTLFHGLLSLRLLRDRQPSVGGVDAYGRSAVRATSLPRSDQKAYAFLYEFVYRRCIEDAPHWTLGRGAARNDIRFGLMMLFADPEWCRRLLGDTHSMPPSTRAFTPEDAGRQIEQFFEFYIRREAGATTLSVALAQDMHSAMLQSAKRFPKSLVWLAFHSRHATSIGESAGSRHEVSRWRHHMRKSAIDALQATMQLEDARRECVKALELLVPESPFRFEALGAYFEKGDWTKLGFENELAKIADQLHNTAQSHVRAREISDTLFRLGEVLATSADKKRYTRAQATRAGAPSMKVGLEAFANAYGAFWVADRLRAAAAFAPDASVDWPVVSARSMRYFVRTALKLSKLLSRSALDQTRSLKTRDLLFEQVNEFYVLARGRIDTYSRHLFRAPAERLNMLLLMASAARVRSTISVQREEVAIEKRDAYAHVSLQYLRDAEVLWCQLGCSPSIAKRLLLERIKTLRRVHHLKGGVGSPAASHYDKAARDDLIVLRQLSVGSPFWVDVVRNLEGKDANASQTY